MARRGANLAGLAALGALGYKLAQGKGKTSAAGESKVSMPTGDDQYDENVKQYMDDTYNPDVKQYMDDTVNPDVKQRVKSSGSAKSPAAPKRPYSMTSDTIDSNVKQRKAEKVTDTGDETARLARRYPAPAVKRTREEMISAIPTDEGKYAPVRGERVTGNETTRNLSNIMNATAGLSVPGYVGKMTQAGYNARAAARRAAGELTPAEIEAAKEAAQAAREAKTLNPNAWMAGPKGMMENFKKGGAVKAKPVKKMASGGAAKPAAKGWGQARGARGAKYY